MEEHELKVRHKAKDREMTISKKLYHSSPAEYEVIEGEPGEVSKPDVFKLPDTNKPKLTTKEEKGPAKNKADKPKTDLPKVDLPKV